MRNLGTAMAEEWRSVRALACLAGATLDEADRLVCVDERDEGGGVRSCLERKSREPCPICWARAEQARR